jgi:hypothetical protein
VIGFSPATQAERELFEYLQSYIRPHLARRKADVTVAALCAVQGRAAAGALESRLLYLLNAACLDARAGLPYEWFYGALLAATPAVQPSSSNAAAFGRAILAGAAAIRAEIAARPAVPSGVRMAAAAPGGRVEEDDEADEDEDSLFDVYGEGYTDASGHYGE